MKLAALINKHAEFSGGLPSCFGDSYLVKNNCVFRQIRKKTLALGFSFSYLSSPEYQAFPMAQLEEILKAKSIPYTNNVSVLLDLNQKTTSTLDWDHVVDNLKPNYVFHESCHAVARSLTQPESDLQLKLTNRLLEESFANTCEFLAIADATDQTHRFFLEMNSYFTVFEDRTHLKKAIEKYGFISVFKFILLCYLHSNFLNDRFNHSDFIKILELSGFKNHPEMNTLKSLAQNVFALNPRFRYATTEMYLRLQGVQSPVKDVLHFDYLKLVATNENLKKLITQLTLVVGDSHD